MALFRPRDPGKPIACVALQPIRCDGKRVAAGEKFVLGSHQFEQLRALGHVEAMAHAKAPAASGDDKADDKASGKADGKGATRSGGKAKAAPDASAAAQD